jgi:predicted phosphodiesterase
MTRLAILADIHGNLPALEAVQRDLEQFTLDGVIVAGDVVNWGPFSAQVMERVVDEHWAVIRGNNEYYLLEHQTPREPETWRHFTLPPWLKRQLAGHWHNVIAAWPDTLSLRYSHAPPIRVAHGSPQSNTDSIYLTTTEAELAPMLAGLVETTLIAGHTHLPMDRRTTGGWRLINPGSVGLPLDGTFPASYALLEARDGDWRATFRRVPYDNEPLFREFERQGFVEECGVVARLAVEEFRTGRLRVLPFLNWHKAACPSAPLTADLLPEFARANIWDYTPVGFHVNLENVNESGHG